MLLRFFKLFYLMCSWAALIHNFLNPESMPEIEVVPTDRSHAQVNQQKVNLLVKPNWQMIPSVKKTLALHNYGALPFGAKVNYKDLSIIVHYIDFDLTLFASGWMLTSYRNGKKSWLHRLSGAQLDIEPNGAVIPIIAEKHQAEIEVIIRKKSFHAPIVQVLDKQGVLLGELEYMSAKSFSVSPQSGTISSTKMLGTGEVISFPYCENDFRAFDVVQDPRPVSINGKMVTLYKTGVKIERNAQGVQKVSIPRIDSKISVDALSKKITVQPHEKNIYHYKFGSDKKSVAIFEKEASGPLFFFDAVSNAHKVFIKHESGAYCTINHLGQATYISADMVEKYFSGI